MPVKMQWVMRESNAEIKARQKRFEQVVEPAAVGVIVKFGRRDAADWVDFAR